MGCSKCGREAEIFQDYSGLSLCRQHFRIDFCQKAKKTIRQRHWLSPGDRYALVMSGTPSDIVLLDFMHSLTGRRRDVHMIAVCAENTNCYPGAEALATARGIPWIPIKGDKVPAAYHGDSVCNHLVVKESLIREIPQNASHAGVNKIVVGCTLQDHAAFILRCAISGNLPQYNDGEEECGLPIVRPFMHIPEHEVSLYAGLFLCEYADQVSTGGNREASDPLSRTLERFYTRHPSVPFALVNMGEQITSIMRLKEE